MKKPDSNGRIFLRSMVITLILLAAVIAVALGAGKAYTAIRKNAFGEQTRAFELEKKADEIRVKAFDWEWTF